MKMTTLADIYNCLLGQAGEKITLDEETINGARRSIDQMILLGQK